MAESYDAAYQRGFREGQGIQNPLPPPPQPVTPAHQAGQTDGQKSNQKSK
jgi:hypothetical protein